MEIRFLEGIEFSSLHRCFLEAFSGYLVPMKSTEEQFREMFARRGADLSISPGAFADGKLVAFTLNAVDRHQNVMTAYDLGSGVPEDLKLSAVRLLHL